MKIIYILFALFFISGINNLLLGQDKKTQELPRNRATKITSLSLILKDTPFFISGISNLLLGQYQKTQELPKNRPTKIICLSLIPKDTPPLYVIDGVIAEKDVLEKLPLKNIQSVTLLRDASATALYGMRGAAGVVLITLEKNRKIIEKERKATKQNTH